jgi:hypothetical protein
MRRSLANLVLAVLLWSYITPVVLATTELDLPPCCRSHGKHHGCTCCMARRNSAGPGFHDNSPRCPCRLPGAVVHAVNAAAVKKRISIQPPSADFLAPTEASSAVVHHRIGPSGRSPPSLPL